MYLVTYRIQDGINKQVVKIISVKELNDGVLE